MDDYAPYRPINRDHRPDTIEQFTLGTDDADIVSI